MSDPLELLSAYLDGELDDAERAEVDALLARSPAARHDLAELAATRHLVRGLAPVEPPRTAIHAIARSGRRPRRLQHLAAGLLAAAAVWLVILSVGVRVGRIPIVPDVAELQAQHASAAPVDGFVPMAGDEMDDPAVMADIGHDMVLDGVFQRASLVHARYSDGVHSVSVFHEPGKVDWGAMQGEGEVMEMDDGPMWHDQVDGQDVFVAQRGDLVVTVVADDGMDPDMSMTVPEMVPPMDMDESFWSKLWHAPGNLLDRI